jgi:hypothetical protein
MPASVTVRGVVLSTADQKPIPGAAVRLSASHMIMTDDQGRFEFTDVAVGKNALIVTQKEGYLCPVLHVPVPPNCIQSVDTDVNYEVQKSRDDAEERAALNSGVLNLTLTLMPAAQVVGRVLDQTGAPVPNLTVALFTREMRDGRYGLSLVGRSVKKTDGWGTFRMDELEPGSYFLRTGAQMTSSSPFSDAHPAVWYPGSSTQDGASSLDLFAGMQKEVDLTVPSVKFHLINIPFTWNRADSMGSMGYGLSSGQSIDSFIVVPPSNQHIFQAYVPNGTYTFSVMFSPQLGPRGEAGQWSDGSRQPFSGSEEFTVDDRTISAPPVPLQQPVDISVHVEATLTQQEKRRAEVKKYDVYRPPQVYFSLGGQGPSPGRRLTWTSPNPNADFAFKPIPLTFEAVPPGSYAVRAVAMQDSYVASLTCGGVDLLNEPLVIGADHPPCAIEAMVRDDMATLGVSIMPQAKQRIDEASVKATTLVLISIDRRQEEPRSEWIWLQASMPGIRVAPGRYLALLTDGRALAWRDPEESKKLQALGQVVTLAPGQSQSVVLDWPAALNDPTVKQPAPRLGTFGP